MVEHGVLHGPTFVCDLSVQWLLLHDLALTLSLITLHTQMTILRLRHGDDDIVGYGLLIS